MHLKERPLDLNLLYRIYHVQSGTMTEVFPPDRFADEAYRDYILHRKPFEYALNAALTAANTEAFRTGKAWRRLGHTAVLRLAEPYYIEPTEQDRISMDVSYSIDDDGAARRLVKSDIQRYLMFFEPVLYNRPMQLDLDAGPDFAPFLAQLRGGGEIGLINVVGRNALFSAPEEEPGIP